MFVALRQDRDSGTSFLSCFDLISPVMESDKHFCSSQTRTRPDQSCYSDRKRLLSVIWAVLLLRGTNRVGAEINFDTNSVYNPCVETGRLKRKDGITIAVGLAGASSQWYNNTDINLNVLSPCSSQLSTQISSKARVAVFRPVVEQLALLRINNASYVKLAEDFPGNASLVVYAGRNPTIVSVPRYFITPSGRVPELTLVLSFDNGKLAQLYWKDDNCQACGSSSLLCIEGSCATPESTCQDLDTSNSTIVNGTDPCRLAINIAFSGTDRYSQLLTTWYQVSAIQKFSLSGLYYRAKQGLIEGLENMDRYIGG